MNTQTFIEKAKTIYNNKFSYEKTVFEEWDKPLIVTCKIHGDITVIPRSFIYKKIGCKYCKINKKRKNTQWFIEKAKEIHGNKYDYSLVEYKGYNIEVAIICPKHGIFLQTPDNHLHGHGCKKCQLEYLSKLFSMSTKDFIKKAKEVHGDKYDYSKVDMDCKDEKGRICIICPVHGKFWQNPQKHLSGKGCKSCHSSHLEENIRNYLNNNKILFEEEKTFTWLRFKYPMYLDFFIPKYNIAIECQGIQHFQEIQHFGGSENFEATLKRDKLKLKLCKEHNINVFYFSNLGMKYPYKVYENKEKLLEDIKKYANN